MEGIRRQEGDLEDLALRIGLLVLNVDLSREQTELKGVRINRETFF